MSAATDASSSRVISREQRDAHARLIRSLADQMKRDEIQELKKYLFLRGLITRKQSDELEGLPAIVDCLEMEMKIKIGQNGGYKELIDTLKLIKKNALADEVEQHQRKFCTDGEADKADKAQYRRLQRELESSKTKIHLLNSRVEAYQRELTTKENDYKQLQKELETTKREKVQLREERDTTMGKTQLLEELDTTKREKTQLREELDTTKREKTQLREELVTTKREKNQLREELDTTKREETELRKELITVKNERTVIYEKLHTITTENTALQKELDTTTKKLQERGQGGGVQGAVGGSGHIQRYQVSATMRKEGVQLAKEPRDIERYRELFTQEYGTSIQSVVNLSDGFAVAYCDQSNKKIKGVDIYDTSGVRQQILVANIQGLRHLAVTPDKLILVAFCDEGRLGLYTIRMYDPASGGYMRSTPQFELNGKVHGFDVCHERQFVILHGDRYNKVTVVSEDRSRVLTVPKKVKSHSYFISCGGRYVYITRDWHNVDVYEITEDRHLKYLVTSQHFDDVRDVSATAAGEVTVTCLRGERYCLGRATFKNNRFSEWKYKDIDYRYQGLDSVGGDYVVVAGEDNNQRMRILRVFKEEV